jgi:acyl carrier protein
MQEPGSSSLAQFRDRVARYLADQTGQPEAVFGPDASLIRARLVDSLTFVQLLDFLDEAGDRLPSGEIDLDGLDTIRALYERIHGGALRAREA